MTRTSIRSGAGWVFGLAATALFISLWGRAVVVDTDALADAAAPLAEAPAVSGLVASWLEDELVDYGLSDGQVGSLVGYVMDTTAADEAIDRFIGEVVIAVSHPTDGSVDVASVLLPAVSDIASTIEAAGFQIPEQEVARVLAGLDPLVIREPGVAPFVGPESPAASRFGTAALLAVLTMAVSGAVALGVSTDRFGEARRLLVKLALGGLSFGILLRLGSWILDPGGGRAPIEEAVSLLARSQWVLPVAVGAVAAALATVMWLMGRLVRPEAASPTPVEQPRLQPTQLR